MDDATATATAVSSGWHRKWLLLCAVLLWLYFLRFRVLGWLLSQILTLALRWRLPQLRIRAHIQSISLRPLDLGHVVVSCSNHHWRVECTRVTVKTHVLEFFRSFVQKKILVVAVEDVFVDLFQLDDELVRAFVRASEAAAVTKKPTAATASGAATRSQKNPMGFMRFIDVRVRTISMNIDAFETRSRFRCSDLSINIPEVFVPQNYLHLSVSVASLFASSRQLASIEPSNGGASAQHCRESASPGGGGGATHHGLQCELASTNIVLDVRLTDQVVIGCTVKNNTQEPAYAHVSTAYVEHLLTKKMELIRREFFPIPTWMWQYDESSTSSTVKAPRLSPFTLRVADFPVTIDVVHSAAGGANVPLQVMAHIRRLEYAKNGHAANVVDQQLPTVPTATTAIQKDNEGVRMSLECDSISLTRDADAARHVFSTTWCRIQMERDNLGHGRLQGAVGELQLAVNPSICDVLHSLVVFPDTIDDHERATLQLMMERVAHRQGRPATALKRKIPVEWLIDVEVDDWTLQSWLSSVDRTTKRGFEAHGKRTTLHSIIPPKLSGRCMKHEIELSEVNADVSLQGSMLEPAGHAQEYSIQLEMVSISTAKLLTLATAPKSMELNLSSSSVVLNRHGKGLGSTQHRRLPGLRFANLKVRQTEVESDESIQLAIAITATEADVTTSHARHQAVMEELRTVSSCLDQVRIMLTPPESPGINSKGAKEPPPKALDLNISASSVRAELSKVEDVAASVEFAVNEMKVMYQKTATGVTNTVTCAFVKMVWDSDPVMDIAGIWFDQAVDGKSRSDVLSDVESTSSSDITMSQIQLWLKPERRLLLLFLKLDELVNANNDAHDSRSKAVPKKTTKQKVNFTCIKLGIHIWDGDETSSASRNVSLNQLKVSANMAKSGKMTDAVLRYLQLTHRDDSCRPRLVDCIQVLDIDGAINVQSLEVASADGALLQVDECLVQYATSDISVLGERLAHEHEHSGTAYIPAKILIFDVSATANHVKLQISPESKVAAQAILPVLQHALDSRPRSGALKPSNDDAPDWRLRYVGTFDCGIERAVAAIPFANDVFTSAYQSPLDISDRFMMLRVDQVAFNCRQFQKLALQFELLRVLVTDHDTEDEADDAAPFRSVSIDSDLPLQVLYLPRTKLDAAIHWRERGSTSSASDAPEQFAVSFDLVLRGSPVSPSDQVPLTDEALLALNWDYIFPALVFLAADETDESCRESHRHSVSLVEEPGGGDATKTGLKCVGIQWNVSVDVVQVAWWDAMTQESAILVVAHDLLSHGIAKRHVDDCAVSPSQPAWVLWETTVYLDLFRAYLLREAYAEDEYIPLACGALPFQFSPPSRFFIETSGTSYRATHALCGSEVLSHDGAGILFGELAFAMADTMHDDFIRVEYNFSNGTRRFSQAEPSSWSSQANPGNGSPPKSPRAWTQSVRAKLARLKRRTSSMDNMLLNDGSRPIQVDSMKLLWTIETRDCAFNMIAVIGESLEAIVEASRQHQDHQSRSSIVPDQLAAHAHTSFDSSERHVTTTKPVASVSVDMSRTGRRGSTRESLLELLHQGKLGKNNASARKSEDGARSAKDDTSRPCSDDTYLTKTIKDKKYTLDVHDVQINILEETSRSSALIASKHIHLEVGNDETATTTIATLRFECVTGHVAPADVEVSSGVLWYAHSRGLVHTSAPPRSSASSQMLLKQVMDEFTLTATYTQGMANGETSVEVDMSSLQLATDRHQFYQLLNVLRHVLLAPPTAINRVKRQFTNRRDHVSEAPSDDVSIAPLPATPPTAPTHTGKKLHAQLVEELRIRDSKMLGASRSTQVVLKLISFRSAGCVFRLRTSPESTGGEHECVEIRAEGITGSHSYFASQNTKLAVNLQWMEINNLRPGPSSIAFEDPMAVLKAKLLVDQRFQSSSRVALANQKGMLSIRAESGPQTRVLGQKLRILDVLEISIFPEIPNMIVIQLAADFYELLYKFFFEQIPPAEHQEAHTNNEHVLFGKKAGLPMINTSFGSSLPSPVTKSRACTSPASPPHPVPTRRKSIQSSTALSSSSAGSESALSISTGVAAEATADDDDASADGCELFYFKYVRIGNVRLRINCNGFFVNLSNFDLDLPPYVCQSKLCTWKKLLQKFESHLKWYVTKESASTGLSHFKNKLLKWTPTSSSASDKKDKQKKEDNTAMNAQKVLFGPYSGTQ